jgi:hypothetical protein
VYDALYKAMCIVPPPPDAPPPPSLVAAGDIGTEEKPETRIELRTFQFFLSEIATWARDERIVSNGFQVRDLLCRNHLAYFASFICSGESIGRLRSMSLLTDCSSSGTRHVGPRYRSRWEMWSSSFRVCLIVLCLGPDTRTGRRHVQ